VRQRLRHFEATCPECGAPTVVPRKIAEESGGRFSWMCRCGEFVGAEIVELVKKTKPLQRGAPLKRRSKKKRSDLAKRLADRWAKTARPRPCASCERHTDFAKGIVVEGHHIVRRSLIEGQAKVLGWDDDQLQRKVWDLRNQLPLCGDCHRRHHSGMKRLTWKIVVTHAPKVEQFAREVELMGRAIREYAKTED
jgi:hypothetical protein